MAFEIEKAQEERAARKEKERSLLTFKVLFFTPERGDFSVDVQIPENDPEKAKKIAIERENIKGYYDAEVIPLRKS